MWNELISSWFPKREVKLQRPLTIKMVPGDHVYLVLFDRESVSFAQMADIEVRMHEKGINMLLLPVYSPAEAVRMVELKVTKETK